MIIAIDGPAGSGKSTIAKLTAVRLGFAYLDTGAMYRAITIRALEDGLDPEDTQAAWAIVEIAQAALISFGYTEGEALPTQVFIDGRDVTFEIRTPLADRYVSAVSALPAVRAALSKQQRRLGAERDTVMEGRDIGTVVFPHAELKVFLTASPQERARRRAQQNVKRGVDQTDEAVILAEIMRRDAYDSSREVAPLAMASDAILLDTTELTIDEVVDRIAVLVNEKRT
ncbi:MAG: (d)CMP kinase [Coriobacteriia bacterium]|nr:(d)CMP kinase [Coriobacteriia bacterium]